MDFGRLKYEKPTNYHPKKILLGNWVEERSNYVKKLYKNNTVYNTFFTPKPYSAPSQAVVWDQKFLAEGYGREIVFDHDGNNYIDNYSTTYDLSYRHFPIFFCKRPPNCGYEKDIDLTQNYGPITNRGLRDMKKIEWRQQISDPRVTQNSTYKDVYTIPKKKDYPKIFSLKCYCMPGDSGCNPITWECVEENKK